MHNRVILISMVKNESKIIERMMSYVLPSVDGIVICDTGSTDNTVEIVEKFLKEKNIPGKVYNTSWVNFGVSRSVSLEKGIDWVNEVGWKGENTFGLFIDADMIFEGKLDKELVNNIPPNINAILLNQKNNSIIYKNTRMIRLNKPWKCIGATHEFWDVSPKMDWEEPIINDIGDGGAKADKFERDTRLLEEELQKNPNNDRTLFYLGQTYQSCGKYEKSNEILERRIKVGGWDEEIYYAYVYRGDNFMSLKKEAEAICEWLHAWQIKHERTEAAMRIIRYYRERTKQQFIGMLFLEKLFELQFGHPISREGAMNKLKKNPNILFVSHVDTEYSIWDELGVLSYYCDKKYIARWRLDEVLMSYAMDDGRRTRLMDLYKWYEEKIKPDKFQQLVYPSMDNKWTCNHASLKMNTKNKCYDVILCYGNYTTTNGKTYSYIDEDIRTTKIVYVQLQKNNTLDNMFDITTHNKYLKKSLNIEDCHIIQNTDEIILYGTQHTDSYKHIQINIKNESVNTTIPTKTTDKNLIPFIDNNNKLKFMSTINPFQILDEKDNIVIDYKSNYNLDGYIGSVPPVKWNSPSFPDENYLTIVHFIYKTDSEYKYYHRFMTIDKKFKPSRISLLMRWTNNPCENITGLSQTFSKNSYNILINTNNSELYLAEMNTDSIEKMLWYNL